MLYFSTSRPRCRRAGGRRSAPPLSWRETSVPAYDYACERCARTFEVRQRISEPPLTECVHCGGPVRRLLAPASFILKGGGWYVTDYPSEARKKGMEAEKKASESASPSSSSAAGNGGAASAAASAPSASTTS